MTKLFINEYVRATAISGPGGVTLQAPEEPPLATQVVDYTAGVAQSAAFNAKTRFVLLHNDSICAIKFGSNPTAVSGTDMRRAANQTTFHGLATNGVDASKVSAITTT
jgi:hypothetical protein